MKNRGRLCDLLMLPGVTPVHKGLTPSGEFFSKRTIFAIQGAHSGKCKGPQDLKSALCFLSLIKSIPMTLKRIYEIDNNNQLIITLPDDFKDIKRVLVTVDDAIDTKTSKLELLKQAASDPLFLSDIREISDDFSHIDAETL